MFCGAGKLFGGKKDLLILNYIILLIGGEW
jgi:hypothetical protein